MLSEKEHFPKFTRFIREHGLESEDLFTIHKLKSVLWAVVRVIVILFPYEDSPLIRVPQGNIAASEGGLHFLEEDETIPIILGIAERSPVLSIRGYVVS